MAWRWDGTGALSKKLIWSRQSPSPAPPQAVTNCKIWCLFCCNANSKRQPTSARRPGSPWCAHCCVPRACLRILTTSSFRYQAGNVAARRAFALHPQKQGKMASCHSSKDCPRTSILDHALQRQILASGHAEAQKHVSHLARKQLLARTHTKCRVCQSHAARARSLCTVEIKVHVMVGTELQVPCTHPARDLHVSRMQPLLGKRQLLAKYQQNPSASMRPRLISGSFATQVHVCLFFVRSNVTTNQAAKRKEHRQGSLQSSRLPTGLQTDTRSRAPVSQHLQAASSILHLVASRAVQPHAVFRK